MKKKSEGQRYLERLEKIDAILEGKLAEQRQWKDLALNISANMIGERVQSSSSNSKMADAVDKCIDMEKEVVEAVDRLIAEKQKVTQTIEKLYSPMEYRILHMRYIQRISLADIAVKLNKDYDCITTTQGRAFKNVEKILEKEKR